MGRKTSSMDTVTSNRFPRRNLTRLGNHTYTMTNHFTPYDSHASFETNRGIFSHEADQDKQLDGFLHTLTTIALDQTRRLPKPVFELDDTEQQQLIERANAYCRYEFDQVPGLLGLAVKAYSTGMIFLADDDGVIMGAEQIHEGDVITGAILDSCIFPVPTTECLAVSGDGEIPVDDQTLSGVITLRAGKLTRVSDNQPGVTEVHDLANFQVSLPLARYLRFAVDA